MQLVVFARKSSDEHSAGRDKSRPGAHRRRHARRTAFSIAQCKANWERSEPSAPSALALGRDEVPEPIPNLEKCAMS